MEKKKIFFIMPSLGRGGAERVMCSLANSFFRKGYTVSFLLTISNSISYHLDEGIKIITNEKNNHPIGQIRFIRKVMKENRAAVFISFMTYQNVYSLIAKLFLTIQVIVSERNDPRVTVYHRKPVAVLRNLVYPIAKKIVFQTKDALEYFPPNVQRKGCLISNPIKDDLPCIYEGERDKRIVAISRVDPQKNLGMMIEAMDTILKKYPNYTLEIYGDTDCRQDTYRELKEKVVAFDLQDKVIFKGFATDVAEKMRRAALYVNTSNYEGISNAMLEAIALGIPAVCTDCPVGGARLFIKNGWNGYLTSVGNLREFTNAVDMAIENVDMQKNCLVEARAIRERLKLDNIADEWLSIINE